MQIVIDIPEELLEAIRFVNENEKRTLKPGELAILNGTPLPKAKDYGFIAVCDNDRPITKEMADYLKETVFVGDEKCSYCFDIVEIIEADKGE